MTAGYLAVALSGLVTSVRSAEPPAYLDACTAAEAHAATPGPWLANDLITLQADTPGLEWEGTPGASNVLVTTFTRSQYYNLSDRQTVTHPELWVVAGCELRDFYASAGVTAEQISLRTKQLLGLPTAATYDALVEVYVNPADIFRPCLDPSISNPTSSTAFPEGVAASHEAWFAMNVTGSYGNANPDKRYPWTQFGYTYDWGGGGTDLEHIQGLSEFVIPSNDWTQTVQTHAVYSVQSYLYTDRQGNFTITGPCDTIWAGSMFTPVDPEGGGYGIEVTADAVISGGQGIYASSVNAEVLNQGKITGPTARKYERAGTENISLLFEHGGRLLNAGEITGNDVAVESRGRVGEGLRILNAGLLEGSEDAIRTGDANDTVMNRGGTVRGHIETGGGDDIVIFQGGVCDGDLDGGAGSDSLLLFPFPGTTFTFTHAATHFEQALLYPGGTVELDGQISATEILIVNGCRTQGVGQFNGNVRNRGVLAPGHSLGTLTVNGDFTNTYAFEVLDEHLKEYKGILEIEANATENDMLVVTGTATLQDGSEIRLIQRPGKPIPNGWRMTLIEAAGGVTDEGAILVSSSPVLHFARVEDEAERAGSDLEVECTRDAYGAGSASGNRARVGQALTVGVDGATGDLAEVLTELDSLGSTAEIEQALGQLTPAAFAAATSATMHGVSRFGSSFLDHLHQAPGVPGKGLNTLDDSWSGPLLAEAGMAAPVTAQAVAASQTASGDSGSGWQGYASAYAASGEVEADDTIPGQKYDTGGTLFGLDRSSADGFRKGLVGGGSYSRSSLDNGGGSATVTSVRLGPSAAITDGPLYAGAFLTYGHHDLETSRRISLGGLHRSAESESDAHDVSALVGGGYDVPLGGFTLTPEGSLQYTWLYEEGASESGAQSLDLEVDSRRLQFLIASAGLRLERPVVVSWGRIIPAVWVRQEHEQQWGGEHRRATFAGVPGSPFQTSWDSPAQDRTRLGMALASVTSARGISVEIRYEFSRGANLSEHLGALTVGVPF
jgi:uncharacterized protein with beta-barrel porin domain